MSPDANPAMPTDELYRQLSPGAFFGLKENEDEAVMGLGMNSTSPVIGPDMLLGGDGKKGYEHFDLAIIDAMSRQAQTDLVENSAHIHKIKDKKNNKQVETDQLIIVNLCFCISYIWRRGRKTVRQYYSLRDIYINHLPFEVGYLTHVIMVRYQNMLELYEYSASLVGEEKPNVKADKNKNKQTQASDGPKITRLQLSRFYDSIQKDSRTVQHLCNMMHELKAKYAARPYQPENKFDIPPKQNPTVSEDQEAADSADQSAERLKREGEKPKLNKAYLAKKIEQSHKLINEALAQRKKKLKEAKEFYNKHGYLPTTKRTQQPMRLWSPNLDYGWSGEEEW